MGLRPYGSHLSGRLVAADTLSEIGHVLYQVQCSRSVHHQYFGPSKRIPPLSFISHFTSIGTLSVFYIVSFVITKSCEWGWNVDLNDPQSPFYVPLYRPSFPALSGMLALALYLHNCVVSIMKNNRQQENNVSRSKLTSVIVISNLLSQFS